EDDLVDTGGLGALGHQLTDLGGGVLVGRRPAAQIALVGGGGGEGAAVAVVDDLGRDVSVGTEHGEAGTLDRAAHGLAHPSVAPDAQVSLVLGATAAAHGYFPALPALRRTCSPE